MKDRRQSKELHVADIGAGYLRFVQPRHIAKLWYMLSEDNAVFLPIIFR